MTTSDTIKADIAQFPRETWGGSTETGNPLDMKNGILINKDIV